MSWDAERLYALLPAIYRIRDQAQGQPIKALLSAIAEQVAMLDEDLEQLYDDQFIETCADWVIPYIGDLIGYRTIHHPVTQLPLPRAEVANTIAYRRRKGTAGVLEQLAADVTGWKAHVVEFFQLLSTTQYLNHLRLENRQSPNLRQWSPLERLDTAFDTLAHTVDVRNINNQRGIHNIPNVGLYLWRLQAYPITRRSARFVDTGAYRYYTFHPLGINFPLFNQPRTETTINQLSQPINVPHPLSRRELYEELELLRQARVDQNPPNLLYFEDKHPVLQVYMDGLPVPKEEILICNLSEQRTIPNSKIYTTINEVGNETEIPLPIRVAVDPVLGRFVLPEAETPEKLEVDYSYGFSDDIGGGPYSRRESVFDGMLRPVTLQIGVSQSASTAPQIVSSLAEAISEWNANSFPGTVGVIAIMDNSSYSEPVLPTIDLPAKSQLMIVSAVWPVENPHVPPAEQRIVGQMSPDGVCAHVIGDFVIRQDSTSDGDSELFLNGLLLEGSVYLDNNSVQQLHIEHCTLTGGIQRIDGELATQFLNLRLYKTLSGPITLINQEGTVIIDNSILDSALPQYTEGMEGDRDEVSINARLAHLEIQTSTLFGPIEIRSIDASNCIFLNLVTALRRQIGCVRFSYLPLPSQVPKRYQCHPQSESEVVSIQPLFTSMRFGNPGYAQLSHCCPVEICQGADDESEIGVFHDLYQPQRETNLRIRLDEYLRFGLKAGIFFAT